MQRTGVAIETQGFSFVTSGKKRESLTGNATLHLYPHFKPLAQMPNLTDYLSTEISTSKQKKFPLVTFVDTPGLVDGDMCYPFDVNESILWLSDLCDLVFVFFDPIGQALCKRTLNIVEKISSKNPERMRFYLSKVSSVTTIWLLKKKNEHLQSIMQIYIPTIYYPIVSHVGLAFAIFSMGETRGE